MLRSKLQGINERTLTIVLAGFFLALAVPTFILVFQAYGQLKWEAFFRHRLMAEELTSRFDGDLTAMIQREEARSFADYSFLNVAGDPAANFLQRSPLSDYPVKQTIPGLVGYFQVGPDGELSTPLLPAGNTGSGAYGISLDEFDRRLALERRVQSVLTENGLVEERAAREDPDAIDSPSVTAPDEKTTVSQIQSPEAGSVTSRLESTVGGSEEQPQYLFERLEELDTEESAPVAKRSQSLGRVEDYKLDTRLDEKGRSSEETDSKHKLSVAQKREPRKEQTALPEASSPRVGDSVIKQAEVRITTFESELDPFDFRLLDSDHFVLFRNVWREGRRHVQGAIIEQQPFLRGVIERTFLDTGLSRMSELLIAYRGNVLAAFSGETYPSYVSSGEPLQGALLYQTRLSDPFGNLEVVFSITELPAGPGGTVVFWLTAILGVVLVAGYFGLHRLGCRQIALARQQQDFVSAVSHELKTPLTSIRMYGEMLKSGWADDDKKQIYYDYIFDESERLSRLISNVLQLARLTRNGPQLDIKTVTGRELLDMIRSKITSQTQRAGFELDIHADSTEIGVAVAIDTDCFAQIVINLVDNAIKFSAKADRKMVEIGCRMKRRDRLCFSVRDHGPGIPRDQMKKIFELFYRSENELTRETVGTGIGLALVHQLVLAMNGTMDVVNRDPGVEFEVAFPTVAADESR